MRAILAAFVTLAFASPSAALPVTVHLTGALTGTLGSFDVHAAGDEFVVASDFQTLPRVTATLSGVGLGEGEYTGLHAYDLAALALTRAHGAGRRRRRRAP